MNNDIEKSVYDYVALLITSTFGFQPEIKVSYSNITNMVSVVVDGTSDQKRMLMGRLANNYNALKTIIKVFCRTNGFGSFFYIKRSEETFNAYEKNNRFDPQRHQQDWQ